MTDFTEIVVILVNWIGCWVRFSRLQDGDETYFLEFLCFLGEIEAGIADSFDFCWSHTHNTGGTGGELTEVFPLEALTLTLVTHPPVICQSQLTDTRDLSLL